MTNNYNNFLCHYVIINKIDKLTTTVKNTDDNIQQQPKITHLSISNQIMQIYTKF